MTAAPTVEPVPTTPAWHPPQGVACVALRVADPLTAAGMRRWLRADERTTHTAEVGACDAVVVAPGSMPLAWVRRAVSAARSDAPGARIVAVLDTPVRPRYADADAVLDLDADVVLTRSELSAQSFVAAVAIGTGAATTSGADADPTTADERAATVLRMLADGHDLAEIAAALFYSERTVKNVLYGYLGRVGARNRVHAVACAIRAGVV